MAPYNPQEQSPNGVAPPVGPHPSFIQVAKPYVFEQELQECMAAIGVTEVKEDTIRLQGVTWIDSVRQALQLPVRTYNTAVVYYHKFRLVHPDNEYDYRDAAAAALFNACKIEDTLKKSRDILCAAYNLKLPPSEHRSSDDSLFESHSKTIVGLERLMLEASGFDFRNRYPQKMLMKLVKSCNLDRDTVGMTSYRICLDLYRTFAPLKQTTQTMALACLELAIRLCDIDLSTVVTEHGFDYEKWGTSREEIMETLVDVLDLYTHHRLATLVGPDHSLDTFIAIRITLNHEASSNDYPRYTQWKDPPPTATPGSVDSKKQANGSAAKTTNGSVDSSISPQSPSRGSVGERGKDGTIRFMLDPGRAKDEKSIVKEYFDPPKEIEEEVDFEIDIEVDKPHRPKDVSLSYYSTAPYRSLQPERKKNSPFDMIYVNSRLKNVNTELQRLAEATAKAKRDLELKKRTAEAQSASQKLKMKGDHKGPAHASPTEEEDEPYSPSDALQSIDIKSIATSPMLDSPPFSSPTTTSPQTSHCRPATRNNNDKRSWEQPRREERNPNLIPVDPRLAHRRFGANSALTFTPAPPSATVTSRYLSPSPPTTPPPAPPPSGAPVGEYGFAIRGAAGWSPEACHRDPEEDDEEEYEPRDVSPRTQYENWRRARWTSLDNSWR